MKPVIWLVLVKDGKRWALHSVHTDSVKAHAFAECKAMDSGEAFALEVSAHDAEEITEAYEKATSKPPASLPKP